MSKRIGFLLVLASLLMSIALFQYARRSEDAKAHYEFREITSESVENIERRLATYGQVLVGVGAYLSVTEEVPLQDYNEYVVGLNLAERYSGIRSISFIRSVSESAVPFLEAGLSDEYGQPIKVHPVTENAEKFVLSRIMPYEGKQAAIGFDLSSEAGRRAALIAARETGNMVMSPRISLVTDTQNQIGFILVRAVFATFFDADTGTSERGDFLGWVVAPFVGADLLSGATLAMGRDYNLRVFDDASRSTEALVFDSGLTEESTGRLEKNFEMQLYGQTWYLSYVSTPAFDRIMSSYLPHAMVGLGLLMTALLAMAFKLSNVRSQALAQVAERRARQLGARDEENRSLLDTTMSAVMILDGHGHITYANGASAHLFGIPQDRFEGREFGDFVTLKPGRQSKDGYNAEGVCGAGRKLLLDLETNGWRTADGEERVTAIVRDVTDAVDARTQIENVRRRYDVALAGAEIGIFEIDLATGKSLVSDTWHKIMGTDNLSEPFDHQTHFMDRVHPEDLPGLLEADRRCIEGEMHRTMAEYRVRFGEEWRWMYSDGIAVERGPDGRGTRLIGTQSDITEIRHARNALEVSEERFRMVVEDAPVGMALMDQQGKFSTVNVALAKLSGYDKDRLVTQLQLSDLLAPDDFQRMARDVRGILREGGAATYQSQTRLRTRSGEERWGLINVSWTHDKNRSENVYIAQVVDITDQKKLEQIKSEFVATVSHELRTPLTSIKGALGLLSATEGRTLGEGAARLLEIARVNADRLTTIVNDILDLEKISSGEVVFEIENNSLGELVSGAVCEMQPFATEHGNELEIEAPDGDLVVRIDANRTRQVLANLMSNACKYSDPDTAVTLRYERLEDEAIIFVRNLGPCIPESFREQIFDAFTQLDGSDTRSKGGTGLGLNITRQIVARHGGRIGFESIREGLTVFWFTVPLVNVAAVVKRDETVQKIQPPSQALRVLHIEDDRDFADVIRAGMGGVADLIHAPSLATARRQLGKRPWDVVLIDWSLPDGDGRALLDEIERANPDACVIVLTASNATAKDPRVDLTLTKSQVEIEDIVQMIQTAGAVRVGSGQNYSV